MSEPRMDSRSSADRLLGPDDPPPVIVANADGASPFVLLGDHAGRAVPAALAGLGLPPGAMDGHIAWDIGVRGLGERLSRHLDAPFIHQAYSRLVIDCNRAPGRADSIPAVSDGLPIPGNAALHPADLAARRDEIYEPYQAAIAAMLDQRARQGRLALLASLHSFTPSLQGRARPWAFGVLHRGDSELSRRVLALLRAELGEAAGDNQPYAMDSIDNTVPLHADPRGLDYLELEVRQDLIADAEGQAWAAALADRLLRQAMATSDRVER